MISQKNEKTAILQMVACAALWSIAGIFIKKIQWHSMAIAGWRSFIAMFSVLIYMKYKKIKFRFTKHAFLNGLFMALTFLCFVTANKLTTAANAIVLQFTSPVFLMLYSAVLYQKKFRICDMLAAVLTLAGITLFFLDQLSSGNMMGNFVAVFAGAFMGAMYLFVGNGNENDRFNGLIIGHALTACSGIPFSFSAVNEITPISILFILILGVFQLGVPYLLYVFASRACPPLACSLLGAVEPLLNPLWVAIFDGEIPGTFAFCGGSIVIVTITVWCIWKGKHPDQSDIII